MLGEIRIGVTRSIGVLAFYKRPHLIGDNRNPTCLSGIPRQTPTAHLGILGVPVGGIYRTDSTLKVRIA